MCAGPVFGGLHADTERQGAHIALNKLEFNVDVIKPAQLFPAEISPD